MAAVLGGLFLLYTAIYATGVLNMSTLYVERWLLNRPITRLDCTFFEWRSLGNVYFSLFFTLVLCAICWRAGYRRVVIPALLVLLLLCVGVEIVGKKMFDLPLPPTLRSGMTVLTCPQLYAQPASAHAEAAAGLWPLIPDPPRQQVSWARDVATMPFVFRAKSSENSYPGGHAMRWSFVWLIASWLCWRHLRRRGWRTTLTVFFLVGAFLGGFLQFWIGVHFITDTISGYLLGAAAACCAIGLLIMNDPALKQTLSLPRVSRSPAPTSSPMPLPQAEHSSSGSHRAL